MQTFPLTYGSSYYGQPSPYTISSSYSYSALVQDTTNTVVGQYAIGSHWYSGVSINAYNVSSPWGQFSLFNITQFEGASNYFAGPDVYQSTGWSTQQHTLLIHSADIFGNSFDQSFWEMDSFQFLEQNVDGVSSGVSIGHHEDHNLIVSKNPWGISVSTLDHTVDSLYEHTDTIGFHSDHSYHSTVTEAHNTSIDYNGPTSDMSQWGFPQEAVFADGLMLKG